MTLTGYIVGTKGNTGRGIASIVENADYTITINLTDGSSYTTAPIAGFTAVDFDENYDLVVTKTDGTEVTVETDLGDYEDLLAGYKSDAESAKADAESAQTYAETAKSGADASALKAEQWAKGTKNGTPVTSGDDGYQDNSKYYKEQAASSASSASSSATSAGTDALAAEGIAYGEQNGEAVSSGSPYYHNNAKYYKEEAYGSATNAATSETNASGSAASASTNALKAEGYSVGKQNGTDVASGSPYYHNNAKYYSGEASTSATSAAGSASSAETEALKSEGFAVGEQNGTPVTSGSPYYHNNAKHFSEQFVRAFPTDTASGAIASFEDGSDLFNYLSCVCSIEPVQAGSGTPSPDNVRPITGWTGCEVSKAGVNLFDAEQIVTDSNHTTHTYISDGYLRFKTGQASSIGIVWDDLMFPCPMAFHGNVKNFDSATNNVRLDVTYDDGTTERIIVANSLTESEERSFSVTIGENGKTVTNIVNAWTNEIMAGFKLSDTQLELGSTATPYTPYNGTTYSISWQTEAGTVYGGTVDVVTGVLTVDRANYDLSQLTWTFDSTRQRWASDIDNTLKKNTSGNTLTGAICDALEEHTPNEIANNHTLIGFSITANPNITLRNGDAVNSPTGNIVAYLATPTTYQLDPTTIQTLLGRNNVWADTGNTSITYKADTQLWVEKQLREINTAILALS